MRGVEAAIRDGWVQKDDWILDTEPTDGQIQVAHKDVPGLNLPWMESRPMPAIHGRERMPSRPCRGGELYTQVHSGLSVPCGPWKLYRDLWQITGGYRPYVVPDSCKVWIDMRLVPPTDTRAAEAIIKQAIDLAQKEVPGVKGHYIITGDRPTWKRIMDLCSWNC